MTPPLLRPVVAAGAVIWDGADAVLLVVSPTIQITLVASVVTATPTMYLTIVRC